MDQPDPDLIVLGLCNHRRGHRFSELKAGYDKVQLEKEVKRTRGIFRGKFKATRIERQRRQTPVFDSKQQRVYEQALADNLERIRARGDELTYQRRFSALCNARRKANALYKGFKPRLCRQSKSVHIVRIYERFMMHWLQERRSA